MSDRRDLAILALQKQVIDLREQLAIEKVVLGAVERDCRRLNEALGKMEYEWRLMKDDLDLVSGALCDAGDVVVEPHHEAIRTLTAQRNAMREALRLIAAWGMLVDVALGAPPKSPKGEEP